MRALLIALVMCLTALTFYVAARQTSTNADAVAAKLTALEAQLAEIQSGTTEITNVVDADSALEAENDELTQIVQALTSERDALVGELTQARVDFEVKNAELDAASEQNAALQQEIAFAATHIAALDGALSKAVPGDTVEQINLLQAQLAERDTILAELRASVTELTANQEARDQAADGLIDQMSGIVAKNESLIASITERDTLISSLEAQLVEAFRFGEDADVQIAALTATLSERDAAIAALQAETADPTVDIPQNDQTAEPITAQTEADENVAQPAVEAANLAEQCVAQAKGILAEAQITFDSGTAAFSDSSVGTLERLSGLAIDCQNDDLIMEIGAHTNSQGPKVRNQGLSEARAQAVLDYMSQLGVSRKNMRAVGFGETQPIQSNASIAGRAANRRITFEWQQR